MEAAYELWRKLDRDFASQLQLLCQGVGYEHVPMECDKAGWWQLVLPYAPNVMAGIRARIISEMRELHIFLFPIGHRTIFLYNARECPGLVHFTDVDSQVFLIKTRLRLLQATGRSKSGIRIIMQGSTQTTSVKVFAAALKVLDVIYEEVFR